MVLGGSVAANKIEKTVASPCNLVDLPTSFNGNLCPVPVFIDDEGTKAQDAVVIRKRHFKKLPAMQRGAPQISAFSPMEMPSV